MNRLEENDLIEAMKETHRLRAALEAAERERNELRGSLTAYQKLRWDDQNRAEVAERGHKACLARDFEQRDAIKALRAERDALRERAEAAENEMTLWQEKYEVAERERQAWEKHGQEETFARERLERELRAQADALREQVEAAREALSYIAGEYEGYLGNGQMLSEYARAALARLDKNIPVRGQR